MQGSQTGRLLTVREAAGALGVSIETVRRWTESGRIKAERTAGGHRRFTPAEIQRAKGEQPSPLRPAGPPDGPIAVLAELLEREDARLLAAAAGRVYGAHPPGWFAGGEALTAWVAALAAGARSGEWSPVLTSTRQMLASARLGGATLLEQHGFLETFGGIALRELAVSSPPPEQLAGARRLFAALRQRLLYEYEAAPEPARAAADALGEALAELLALPDLEWVAVYEADPAALALELRAYAGAEGEPRAVPGGVRFGTGAVGRVALARHAVVEQPDRGRRGPTALAPMLAGGDVAGVLALGLRRARPIGDNELRLLEALAAALAQALRGDGGGIARAVGTFRAAWAAPAAGR